MMVEDGIIHCIDLPGDNPVNWADAYCSYGVLKEDVTKTEQDREYICIDSVSESKTEEKDIRETKTRPSDNKQYRWSYVVSSAKLFDRVFTNEYTLEPYYEYSLTNYNNFINKVGSYRTMTVDAFKDSEETNSKADVFQHNSKDYNVTEPKTEYYPWLGSDLFVRASIPAGATLDSVPSTRVIKKDIVVNKVGKEYTDTYNWFDELIPGESNAGTYNMDSIKDVTGEDGTPLDGDDTSYYNKIYKDKELNIIDLMNSSDELYQNYIAKKDASSDNIGIRRGALDISYNVLKVDLEDQLETYESSGLIYGNSLGISSTGSSMLSSLDLSSIVAAGDVNQLIATIAESFKGHRLSTFRNPSFEDYDCFPWSQCIYERI